MLPKNYRLPHSVRLTPARSLRHSLFILKYEPGLPEERLFGVVISKKVDKRATHRNRMRRILHTFIQDNLTTFPKGYRFLFLVQKPFEDLTASEREELRSLLTKVSS